jgi:8-oxo-dGTP pyrophosphatase MutT (NUDIX family)
MTTYARTWPGDGSPERDPARILELLRSPDPWSRLTPLHLTASALIVHRASLRVLLRWHERLQLWAQVGGHADPGETDPVSICLREAFEETGLDDVRLCGLAGPHAAGLIDAVIVRDPGRADEPPHEHADLRYLLETSNPDRARAERLGAPVRWLSFEQAIAAVGANNLSVTLERAQALLAAECSPGGSV